LFPPEEGETFHSMIDEEGDAISEADISEAKSEAKISEADISESESEADINEAVKSEQIEDPNIVSDSITDLKKEIESEIESEVKKEIIDELSPIIRSEVAKVKTPEQKQAFGGKSSIIKRLTRGIKKAAALNPSSRKIRK
jgi:hypothetical protein